MLGRADQNWKRLHGDKLFDGSYLAQRPSNWANQRIGLTMATHLSNHINASMAKIRFVGKSGTLQTDKMELDLEGDENSVTDMSIRDFVGDWKSAMIC